FFAPQDIPGYRKPASATARPFKIVHVTNHPGIEGTSAISTAIENLRAKGFDIEFLFLSGKPHDEVLRAFADADLTIGKLKMGHYANAQIESMALGVPAVTYVRPEFMTPELKDSGFIFTELDKLESILEYYIGHPPQLQEKRAKARASILRLHDNAAILQRLKYCYKELTGENNK
ncbi:MAG TPA: glycosyltransferase, partial [Elusimicrobiales bacterium]|nr:glycosyltransferase [Elusimicrobiales bacterium]